MQSEKVSPYFAEFVKDEFIRVDAIAAMKSGLLDVLIYDMEKLEARAGRAEDRRRRKRWGNA